VKIFFRIFLIFACVFLFAISVFAADYPKPAGFVNDYAGIYSSDFKIRLENKLKSFEEQTGGEIAVAAIKSLEGQPVEEYAVKLFEKWKIGKARDDNGLLLLIAKDDREVRIEVGYGFEPYINDARAGDIIRNDIVPEFKNGNYEAGTGKATDSLMKFIANKDFAPKIKPRSDREFPFWAVLAGIYIFATYLASYLGRTKEIWPGAAIGGFFGVVIGLLISSFIAVIIAAIIAGLFGLWLDFILSRNYKIRKAKGLPTGFWHSGGGFRSGSGGSSFGGFGGGSSGGGGASGRW